MIDHVSIEVRDLAESKRFYETVLGVLDYRTLIEREHEVGFGKAYPEFWLNARPGIPPVPATTGNHVALRTKTRASVDRFYEIAIEAGASPDGAPGLRPEYSDTYYAAFVRDPDGHRVEVVTFLPDRSEV